LRKNPEERAILNRLKIGILLALVFCWGCGRNTQVDDVTQALALTLRTFINFFQDNLGNCDLFLQIYDELTETVQECDNPGEGTFQLTKISVICENGPPLTATADFILDQTDCQDNGTKITSTGSMTMTLSFSAAGNIGILASTNLVAQDMTFVFDNFQTKVDLSNNNLSCGDSGDLTVDGSNCSVSSNCQKCNF